MDDDRYRPERHGKPDAQCHGARERQPAAPPGAPEDEAQTGQRRRHRGHRVGRPFPERQLPFPHRLTQTVPADDLLA